MLRKTLAVAIASLFALNCSSSKSSGTTSGAPSATASEPVAATHAGASIDAGAARPTQPAAAAPASKTPPLVEIPNAALLPNALAGGQPSPEQYAAVAKAGYTTVIDLRAEGEAGSETNGEQVKALGMNYVRLPIASPADMSKEAVAKFSEALAGGEGPVVVHCASGNRVGAMFGLEAYWQDGMPAAEAMALAKKAGLTQLEEFVATQLGLSK